MIFIDEIHDLSRKDLNDTIYTISRFGEDLAYFKPKKGINQAKKSQIGYIFISNDLNLRDKLRIWLAYKFDTKIYFLIKGGRYLCPREYYLVIDFKEKKFFFAYYIENSKTESCYSKTIQGIINKIEKENK